MNLPENPTPEQLVAIFAMIIESVYTDGVEEIISGPRKEGGVTLGKFRDGRKIFDVEIRGTEITIKPSEGADPEAFGEGDDPAFAEADQDDDEAIATKLATEVAPTIEGWLNQIKARLESGDGDLASFADELDSLYPELDPMQFAAVMGQAMSLARLAGGDDANN